MHINLSLSLSMCVKRIGRIFWINVHHLLLFVTSFDNTCVMFFILLLNLFFFSTLKFCQNFISAFIFRNSNYWHFRKYRMFAISCFASDRNLIECFIQFSSNWYELKLSLVFDISCVFLFNNSISSYFYFFNAQFPDLSWLLNSRRVKWTIW